MSQNTEVNKKKFIEAYSKNGFDIANSCKAAKICRKTFERWNKGDEEFAQAIEDAEESVLDKVEASIIKRAIGYTYTEKKVSTKVIVKDGKVKGTETTTTTTTRHIPGDVSAARDFMRARGRDRGYGMRDDDSDADQFGEQ